MRLSVAMWFDDGYTELQSCYCPGIGRNSPRSRRLRSKAGRPVSTLMVQLKFRTIHQRPDDIAHCRLPISIGFLTC